MAAQDFDRFRSFAERYIIGRAALFRAGFEREDAWRATLDAKTIYSNIARMSLDAEPLELEVAKMAAQMRNNGAGNATQAGVGTSAGHTGATGPIRGPMGPTTPPGTASKPPSAGGLLGPPAPTGWLNGMIEKLMAKESRNGTP